MNISPITIASLAVCVIALFLTFRAKFVVEKLLRKEATDKMILRVKYTALILAVIAFLATIILK